MKFILNCIVIALGMTFVNGCAITAATVAGVTAYEVNQSNSDPEKVSKSLQEQINNSYFAVAILDKTMVLAGQVPNKPDVDKAKNIISKKADDYTIYSYLKVEAVESKQQQDKDKVINNKVLELIKSSMKNGGTSTVANSEVYLLIDNKQTKETLDSLSDKIFQIKDVKTVVTIQKRS